MSEAISVEEGKRAKHFYLRANQRSPLPGRANLQFSPAEERRYPLPPAVVSPPRHCSAHAGRILRALHCRENLGGPHKPVSHPHPLDISPRATALPCGDMPPPRLPPTPLPRLPPAPSRSPTRAAAGSYLHRRGLPHMRH
jgi:hypothetical protein